MIRTHDGVRRREPTRRGVLRGTALAALGLAPALGAATAASAAGPPWARPLAGGHRVSAAYGVPGDWEAGHHTGIDFAVASGTPVYSVGRGTVDIAGTQGDYGEAVVVRMDDGHFVLYAHLSRVLVAAGERVHGGERIGKTGATGRVTGPHLHFEVRASRDYGTDVDPVAYLARRGVVLL
ncbi:M23 family metallopeptidase [Streptomyces sp. TRM 70351]|uniref:M23 family metallopeptidase n=1 Tax=Streptomyces sp. TRM 70351 TaxID=3116552 RepID=UPI002E7BD48D|nr:M23 family metallopeptidase [Streptomyces sp. TRM 70351]MEE1928192.1 M23 family metallopeptidase [Streptomyces sp. TRM 70351]